MRAIITLLVFVAVSFTVRAQLATKFTVSSNDVVQSSIIFIHSTNTNETRVTVKFAYTDTGAQRLEEFYREHTIGEHVYWQSGKFVFQFAIDNRKFFGRDGFWLPEQSAKALVAGLRGE